MYKKIGTYICKGINLSSAQEPHNNYAVCEDYAVCENLDCNHTKELD